MKKKQKIDWLKKEKKECIKVDKTIKNLVVGAGAITLGAIGIKALSDL